MAASWSESVALITGGTRGIGRAIALRLARNRPRHLVLAYASNHDAARDTVADLRALGVSASAIVCDVADDAMIREMFRQIESEYQRLDIFVASAARTSFQPAATLDARSWRRTIQINAEAFLVGSQLAAPLMMRHDGGRIVALSSLGSRFHVPSYAALGAAKAALESLARSLAVELAPAVNVNVVCAGFVETDSLRSAPGYERIVRSAIEQTPGGRMGRPDDVAGVVAFLCSPDADWIRGQAIVVDGGYSLGLAGRDR